MNMTKTISREELRSKIESGDEFKLVETLPPILFRQAHLPGAVNLPPQQVVKRAPSLLPDKNAEIVVYCESQTCRASDLAADELTAMGYTRVRDYAEGKEDWIKAGLPVERDFMRPKRL
jgi:rhodanese-related sulfurtransferase